MARLLEKANTLPLRPGVYLMKNAAGRIIYVGKSRKLKNRVSQYFQNSEKNIKTARMVSCVQDFDYILCDTEMEALTLENTLIKEHTPRYNIRLKDAKSYPYIKLTLQDAFPRLMMTRHRANDGAAYFGPYSGTSAVYEIIDMLNKTLGLPSCGRRFDGAQGAEGKPGASGRKACLYRQMRRCLAPCMPEADREEYARAVEAARRILTGKTGEVIAGLESKMQELAEAERFEEAARCRDSVAALKKLSERQKVVSDPTREFDLFALYSGDTCSCISLFCVRGGALIDKDEFISGAEAIAEEGDLPSLICHIYERREYIPSEILVANELEEEDMQLLTEALEQHTGRKIHIHTPQRGELRGLCRMALDNARDKAEKYAQNFEKDSGVLLRLAEILGLEVIPSRIEAYDISNIGRENTVCGMIVAEDGKLKRADYRSFNIASVAQDDYGAMREALLRRFSHLTDPDGSFSRSPDLILLDGGRGHVGVAQALFAELGLQIPVFGMVKDEHHKTRALCSTEGDISIAREQAVFVFIYRLQEEVHRFSVSRSGGQKRRSLRRSSLESISGIGPEKAKTLLSAFRTLSALKEADVAEIGKVKGISQKDAEKVYCHFHPENEN